MKNILVATDGSKNSERALLEARKYAEWSDGKVTILTIVKPFLGQYTAIGYQPDFLDQQLENVGESILLKSLKLFDGFEGQVTTKLRRGDPADEILKEADEGAHDLLVMGSRGLGVFSRTILGSVSNKVLNHTKINILIIK